MSHFLQNSLNLSISIYAFLSLEVAGEERVTIITLRSDTLHHCVYSVEFVKSLKLSTTWGFCF
jgi:hypothetical protein